MINKDIKPEEAIRIAIDKEAEAYKFYDEASKIVKDKATKEMFVFLAKEELKHKRLLEGEYEREILREM